MHIRNVGERKSLLASIIHTDSLVCFNFLPICDPQFSVYFLPGFLLLILVSMNDKLLNRKRKKNEQEVGSGKSVAWKKDLDLGGFVG